MLNDLVICLWMLSHLRKHPLDWAGCDMSVEAAAKHHDWFRNGRPAQ